MSSFLTQLTTCRLLFLLLAVPHTEHLPPLLHFPWVPHAVSPLTAPQTWQGLRGAVYTGGTGSWWRLLHLGTSGGPSVEEPKGLVSRKMLWSQLLVQILSKSPGSRDNLCAAMLQEGGLTSSESCKRSPDRGPNAPGSTSCTDEITESWPKTEPCRGVLPPTGRS